jgi:hypothetical protein
MSHARGIFNKYNIPRDIQSHIICQALEKEGAIAYTYAIHLHKSSLADKALAEIVAFLKNHI